MVITCLDGGTSVSLRPEDSKAPLLELWAWRLEQEEHVDSQASVNRNSSFEAQKSPFCCLASDIYMTDDINCFYKESAAALDWSGSECSRLPHMSMFRFFLLLSSLDPCLYLIFSTLLILILQHA